VIFKNSANLFAKLPIHIQRSLRLVAGWLAIGFGIIGILLPLLPGIPFLLLGSWLLGWELTLLKEIWGKSPFAHVTSSGVRA
jgi:hypothetical protein